MADAGGPSGTTPVAACPSARGFGPSGSADISVEVETLSSEMEYLALVPLLFGLSFLSGMLGLGVAFIAISRFDWGLVVATSIAAVIAPPLAPVSPPRR